MKKKRTEFLDYYQNVPFIILGKTLKNKTFRPSDWNYRLTGCLSKFCSQTKKLTYNPYAMSGIYDNLSAVFVDNKIAAADYESYKFLINFALDNNLQIIDAICSIDKKK